MKTLVIVRHGAFDHSDPQIADVNRPLNRKGKRHVEIAAGRFSKLQIKPDLLISSPAKRSVETAVIFAEKLAISPETIQVEKCIFEAERAEILRVVRALDSDVETAVLFGHHPGVTELLHHLTDSDVEKIQLGAFAVLEFHFDTWRAISFKRGIVREYVDPEEKRQLHAVWRFLGF